MELAAEITCLECGDVARLISFPDEDGGFAPGEVVIYSCRSCFHRWDVVLEEDALEGDVTPD